MAEPFRINGLVVEGTGAITIPVGSSAQRPAGEDGLLRINGETSNLEFFVADEWVTIGKSGMQVTAAVSTPTHTIVTNTIVPVNTAGNAITCTLPADPLNGDRVILIDINQSFHTNNLTVTGLLDQVANATVKFTQRSTVVEFMFIQGAGWITVNNNRRSTYNFNETKTLSTIGPHDLVPGVLHFVNTTGLASQMVLRMPTSPHSLAPIGIIDIGGNLAGRPVFIDTNTLKVDGLLTPITLRKDYCMAQFISAVTAGVTSWHTLVNTDAAGGTGSLSGVLAGTISGTAATLTTGKVNMITTQSAAAAAFMPANPSLGDIVTVVDAFGTFSTNNFTLKRAASGEYINGENLDFVFKKDRQAASFRYSGTPSTGWLLIDGHKMFTHSGWASRAQASVHDFNFRGDTKTIEVAVTGNTEIRSVTAPTSEATAFFIILKIDGVGGHNIILPSVSQGWFPSKGSQVISTASGNVAIIQGLAVNSSVFYSVTNFTTT